MKTFLILLFFVITTNVFAVNSADRDIETTILSLDPRTTAEINAFPSPAEGDVAWNTTTGELNVYDGAQWEPVQSATGVTKVETVNNLEIYVSPTGDDSQLGVGSQFFPYQTIQAAFDDVADATSLNQWANERITIHLLPGEYTEPAITLFYKRRSVNIVGHGAKINNNVTLNYDPTAQYTGFTYTQAGLPQPWTNGFASPTLSLGCENDMNGMESGFTTGCLIFMGRVVFTTPNYTTQTSPNYGTSYVTMNGVEARAGFQVNDSGASSNSSVVLEMMNSVVNGNNLGLTRAGGTASAFTLKASNSRPTSVIGPVVIIGALANCRVGKLDRTTDTSGTTGMYASGAIQFTNTSSTYGITNSTFAGSGTQNIGNASGTTNSVMKIDKQSWYSLRTLTLDFGGGVTWNITDAETYTRVVATNGGSTTISQSTDHLLLDPAATIATYTVTMPAKPFDKQRILISAGGSGSITALTLSANSGQAFATGASVSTLAANTAVEYEWNNTTSVWYKIRTPGVGTGDVVGPSSSVDGEIALFDLTTGKLIKRATGTGVVHATSGVYSVANVNLASEVTGTLPVANGGTGASSLTANNVILGDGTNPVQFVAPGSSGNILTSNGTTWTSSAAPSAITTLNTLTAATQTFATGTSGTDFNISSATSTHTFNIPIADATNTGKLDNDDWVAFDAKVDGPGISVDGEFALFDSTTGKLIKAATGSGVVHSTSGVYSVSNIDLTSEVSGILPVANGGTGASSLAANNVLLGDGTNPLQVVAPGSSGNVLTSNGTTWSSAAPSAIAPTIFGSRSTPRNIQTAGITTAGSHMSNSAINQDIYVCGSSDGLACNAAITITTISAGTIDGQVMCIFGRDSTNTVEINGGTTTNVDINGNAILGASKNICLRWDTTNWQEISRNF